MDALSLTARLQDLHPYLLTIHLRCSFSPISGIINVCRQTLV
jgi:hypothetical protein